MDKNVLSIVVFLLLSGVSSAAELQEISVEITTPNTCYSIMISDIYSSDDKTVVVAKVLPPPMGTICGAMIGQVGSKIYIDLTVAKKVEFFVVGRSWCWERPSIDEGYFYPISMEQVNERVTGLDKIFSQDIPKGLLAADPIDRKGCER